MNRSECRPSRCFSNVEREEVNMNPYRRAERLLNDEPDQEPVSAPSPCLLGFSALRCHWFAGVGETVRPADLVRQCRSADAERRNSARRFDFLEDSVNLLISAAVLGSLLLLAFSLPDARNQARRSAEKERFGVVEQGLSIGSNFIYSSRTNHRSFPDRPECVTYSQ